MTSSCHQNSNSMYEIQKSYVNMKMCNINIKMIRGNPLINAR